MKHDANAVLKLTGSVVAPSPGRTASKPPPRLRHPIARYIADLTIPFGLYAQPNPLRQRYEWHVYEGHNSSLVY